jgi:hypothetical protein
MLHVISIITNNVMHVLGGWWFVLRFCTHEIDAQFRSLRVYIVSYYIAIFDIIIIIIIIIITFTIIILYDRCVYMCKRRTCLRVAQSDKTTNSVITYYYDNMYIIFIV